MFHDVVSELRRSGCRVRVAHLRNVPGYDTPVSRGMVLENGGSWNPSPRGGICAIDITFPNGDSVCETARCSNKDAYNKHLGREIVIGRLIKTGELGELLSGV